MSLKMRLARGGAKKRPYYRIVIADSRKPRDGRFIERIGTYNPLLPKDHADRVTLVEDRVKYWLGVGARPSDRVNRFLDAAGILKREARNNPQKAQPGQKRLDREEAKREAEAKAKEEAKAAKSAKAEAPAQEAVADEAPADEAPAEEAAPQTPAEDAPAEEAAAEEAPAAEASADASAEEAPAEEASVEEATAEETTSEDAAAEKAEGKSEK